MIRPVPAEIPQFVSLIAAAVLTGNELGTWAVVHPAIQRLEFRQEVRAEQEITRRYGYVMPALMLLTIVSGFVTVASLGAGSESFALTLAGTLCFTAMLAITLAGNVPVNVRTLQFGEEGRPPEWRAMRRRWDRLHAARVALDAAGLACLALAALA